MTQHFCTLKQCFKILPASFVPSPKVDTAVVHVQRRLDMQDGCPIPFNVFEDAVRATFASRRRRLRHGLKTLFDNDINAADDFLEQCHLPENVSAMKLSNEQIARIATEYSRWLEKKAPCERSS